jgi:hypothetical protein
MALLVGGGLVGTVVSTTGAVGSVTVGATGASAGGEAVSASRPKGWSQAARARAAAAAASIIKDFIGYPPEIRPRNAP